LAQSRDTTSNISLRDVEEAARVVQREFNCNITFALSMPMTDGTPCLFWVNCTATPRWVGKKTIRAEIAVQRRWPHVDHRTLAGLLLWLVNEMYAKLEAQGLVATQAALWP